VEPELFFTLRGVDPKSIISAESVVDTLTADTSSELESSDLGDVFGIALDGAAPSEGAEVRSEGVAEDLPALFKATRKRLGFSQAKIAKVLGTNQTTISAIERGGMSARASALVGALRKLG